MWKPAREIQSISSSSVLDLKAELQKEKQQFHKDKVAKSTGDVVLTGKKLQKPKSAQLPSNRGVEERNRRDLEEGADSVTPSIEQSWIALQRKTKLYDKLKAEGGADLGEKGEEESLVDFVRKAYESRGDDDDDDGGRSNAKSRRNQEETDPWVEYIDEFGRTRIVRKSQLPELPPQPRAALTGGFVKAGTKPGKDSDEPSLLSKDMMTELARQDWEQSAQDELEGRGPPAHYDAKREIRTLGVGFYQLSQDDMERAEQIKELNSLRSQTKQARDSEKARKDKRKDRLEERRKLLMAKAKRRKGQDGGAIEDGAGSDDSERKPAKDSETNINEDQLRAVDDFLLSVRQQVERSSGVAKKRAVFGDLLDET